MCGTSIVVDISVGVTGEEIRDVDGVFEVFCAIGERGLDSCKYRDIVDGCKVKAVAGGSRSSAVSDVVGEVDGPVEVLSGSESPASACSIQLKSSSDLASFVFRC